MQNNGLTDAQTNLHSCQTVPVANVCGLFLYLLQPIVYTESTTRSFPGVTIVRLKCIGLRRTTTRHRRKNKIAVQVKIGTTSRPPCFKKTLLGKFCRNFPCGDNMTRLSICLMNKTTLHASRRRHATMTSILIFHNCHCLCTTTAPKHFWFENTTRPLHTWLVLGVQLHPRQLT